MGSRILLAVGVLSAVLALAVGLRVGSGANRAQAQDAIVPTLFVSPGGADSNDGRSSNDPVQTLARALKLANVGDVVGVLPGDYPVQSLDSTTNTSGSTVQFLALGAAHFQSVGLRN